MRGREDVEVGCTGRTGGEEGEGEVEVCERKGRRAGGSIRPLVQVERADFGDVRAEVSVYAGTLDADEHPEIQAGPLGICIVMYNGSMYNP